jgi:hypothetical protein
MNPSLNEYRGAVRPFRFISCMETARGVGRSRNGRAWTPVVDGRDGVREDVLSHAQLLFVPRLHVQDDLADDSLGSTDVVDRKIDVDSKRAKGKRNV